jgi:hypothetical protein
MRASCPPACRMFSIETQTSGCLFCLRHTNQPYTSVRLQLNNSPSAWVGDSPDTITKRSTSRQPLSTVDSAFGSCVFADRKWKDAEPVPAPAPIMCCLCFDRRTHNLTSSRARCSSGEMEPGVTANTARVRLCQVHLQASVQEVEER